MTTAVVSPKARADAVIGLSSGADLTGGAQPARRIAVITGVLTTESEYSLVPLDAIFIRSLDDFQSVGSSDTQSFLVTESGFPLAAELIELGQLSPDSPITWSLQAPLNETLEQLGLLGLPKRISVHGISGTIDEVVVSTAAGREADQLDLESFKAGFAVNASLLGHGCTNHPGAGDGSLLELNELRRKHLSLLEVLIPLADQPTVEDPTPEGPSDEVLKLEEELLLLKERYDALESEHQALEGRYQALDGEHRALDGQYQVLEDEHRTLEVKYTALEKKYHALANSRLGKLTLRLWQRKTPKANEMQSKAEA
ncbi:hypothetical protein [Paenarthrobacter sp. NPDC018779]|uniref:hypothetical protein n=1 Tax=Paenarthrobacter sp. NPDC018779 TaxID=3364375 RepID=UPI0037C53472